MTQGPPQHDVDTGDDGHRKSPNPNAAASTFDAAADLLQAALDEVREAEADFRSAPLAPASSSRPSTGSTSGS